MPRRKGVRNRKTVVLDSEYDGAGKITKQIEKVTSYDNATVGSGTVVNEVLRQYNDATLLAK